MQIPPLLQQCSANGKVFLVEGNKLMSGVTQLGSLEKTKKRFGSGMKLARREAMWGFFFLTPWIIGFLAFFLVPMVASFIFSMFEFNLATPDLARFVGTANWKRMILDDKEVAFSFMRTFRFALYTLPIGLGTSLFLAILVNSRTLFGKNLFRTLFYLPSMIPLVATVLIWQGVFNEQTGWVNLFIEKGLQIKAMGVDGIRWFATPSLVYFTYSFIGLWGIGNTMLILLAGLQNVPTELYEAATVDGAGWWRRLFHITLPMISPVIFYNLIISVITLLQYFLVPYVLNNGTGFPEGFTRFNMVYFYKQAFTFFSMGYGAALAWLQFVIALILTLVLFGTAKYWVYYASEEA